MNDELDAARRRLAGIRRSVHDLWVAYREQQSTHKPPEPEPPVNLDEVRRKLR